MADIIQLRRDTAANWHNANPILAQAEPGVETDSGKFKIGDGVTHWDDLLYATGNAPSNPSAFSTMIATIAIFTLDISTIRVGSTIAFALAYETLYPIASFYWDFGDGQTSTLPSLNKSYGTPGSKQISCLITDTQNNSVSAYYQLNVQSAATTDIGQSTIRVDSPLSQMVHNTPVIDQSGTIDVPLTLLATPAPVIMNNWGVDGTNSISQQLDQPLLQLTHSLTITNT